MKQQKKVSIHLLAAALAVCLLLPLVGCGGREPQPATEVERLSKLCRVWGYVKYTHPAFLLGQKDWDEELLALIPQVRELETNEEVGPRRRRRIRWSSPTPPGPRMRAIWGRSWPETWESWGKSPI